MKIRKKLHRNVSLNFLDCDFYHAHVYNVALGLHGETPPMYSHFERERLEHTIYSDLKQNFGCCRKSISSI